MPLFLPDYERLIGEVMARCTNRESLLHGPDHWRRVSWTGLHLLNEVPEADAEVVFLFGLFHDAMRLNDAEDPEHGPRAGELVLEMADRLPLSPAQVEVLKEACDLHADGHVTMEPTVGVCWDADRLNLWRVAIRPDPFWLSTEAAKRERRILWARDLHMVDLEWATVHRGFDRWRDSRGGALDTDGHRSYR